MPKEEKTAEPTSVSYDWKETPTKESLRKALEQFGVHVYDNPACEGSDSYGFVFSGAPMTKGDLEKWAEDSC